MVVLGKLFLAVKLYVLFLWAVSWRITCFSFIAAVIIGVALGIYNSKAQVSSEATMMFAQMSGTLSVVMISAFIFFDQMRSKLLA